MSVIKVSDFSRFPGPRYERLGPYSGEVYRDTVLIPALNESADKLIVDLDGAFGYGSSFLEEAFGGLVRKGIDGEVIRKLVANIKSDNQPELKIEISDYVETALKDRG